MKLKDQYPMTPIIDLLPKCYEEERKTLIQKIHYKYIVDLAIICIVKSNGKLYLIKFKEQSMIKDRNINKVLNTEYKVVSNNHCKSYVDWISFHKSTEGQYKVRDNILIDLDN